MTIRTVSFLVFRGLCFTFPISLMTLGMHKGSLSREHQRCPESLAELGEVETSRFAWAGLARALFPGR